MDVTWAERQDGVYRCALRCREERFASARPGDAFAEPRLLKVALPEPFRPETSPPDAGPR